jgi:hypothetical protein
MKEVIALEHDPNVNRLTQNVEDQDVAVLRLVLYLQPLDLVFVNGIGNRTMILGARVCPQIIRNLDIELLFVPELYQPPTVTAITVTTSVEIWNADVTH